VLFFGFVIQIIDFQIRLWWSEILIDKGPLRA